MIATLTYHSIDDSGSAISIPRPVFDEHLAWLTSGRVQPVGLDALPKHPRTDLPVVSVTFDDGFANIRDPVERLRAAGVPVTVFVVSSHVGKSSDWGGQSHPSVPTLPLLTWADLERFRSIGVDVEAHTRSHPALSRLSDQALDDELGGCRQDLATRLGVDTTHVAYPYGDIDARVSARARAHFRFGHTTEFRQVETREDPLRLPRLDLYYFQAPGALAAAGRPGFKARVAWLGARRLARHLLLGGPFPGAPRRWTR